MMLDLPAALDAPDLRSDHQQPGEVAKFAGSEEAVLEHQTATAKHARLSEPQEVLDEQLLPRFQGARKLFQQRTACCWAR